LTENETRYKRGNIDLIISTHNSTDKKIKKYYHYENGDTIHYLTWTYIYDKMGREIKRVQKFYDRNTETVYIKKYRRKGKKKISVVKTNGKTKFKIISHFDKNDNVTKSIHIEKNYKSITEKTYTENGLKLKTISKTYKKGKLTEIDEYLYEYSFYEKSRKTEN